MGKALFAMPSYTHAMKAQELLARHGFRATVRRLPKTAETGCGYGVFVAAGADGALRILREHGIKILARLE